MIWRQSSGRSYCGDGTILDYECEVKIDDGKIVVSYDDDGLTTYAGQEVSPGHFRLACPSKKGRATLHRMPDDDVLEGFWIEGSDEGMWRIHLDQG